MSEIYDLGYKRYAGARLGRGTRWLVVARNQIAMGWKTWWRWKLPLVLAVIATIVGGALLVILADKTFRIIQAMTGRPISFADGIIPFLQRFYRFAGFVLSLTLGTVAIASDLEAGALTFYFARSVRPRDYTIGKLVGFGAIAATVVGLGPVILGLVRVGLAGSQGELVTQLSVLPKALAIGLANTLVFTAVPLAFSAIVGKKRYGMALWAVYYWIIGGMALLLGFATKLPIAAIDLGNSLDSLAFNLFDVRGFGSEQLIPLSAAVISIAAHVTVAIGLVAWRMSAERTAGVGGTA